MTDADSASSHDGSTSRTFGIGAPLAKFLRTESGSSTVLLVAIVLGLVWANTGRASYEGVWSTDLAVRLGDLSLRLDLREWVGSGLMTLFFVVVGLEARREIDLGSLRERRRLVIPVVAGITGMALPVAIFLIVTAGGPAAHGWGVAMSTDTALALGLVTLVGRHLPEAVRGFLVTLFIVDDVVALIVIALVYSSHIEAGPLIVGLLAFAAFIVSRTGLGGRIRPLPTVVSVAFAVISWLGLLVGGVDPVVLGLGIGLSTAAYSPTRDALEQASGEFRRFREQPTSAFARTASAQLQRTLSPNERMQGLFLPWTTYVIVPLFALANTGIPIDPGFLAKAYTSPVTIGIVVAYVVGKPVAVLGAAWLVTRLSRGRLQPPVGWAAVLGSGTIAGVGFTVAVLIATLAFSGVLLDEAKLGILTAALLASVVTWAVYRIVDLLPSTRRTRALLGNTGEPDDLACPVEEGRDHSRGPATASVTIVEYGDFQCPYCGRAEPAVRSLDLDEDIRFVWRHLPLVDVHPQAQLAAEAAEAAAVQGAFWSMHDLLLTHQDALTKADLLRYAEQLALDVDAFGRALTARTHRDRVLYDLQTADASSVSGTPTFFINGKRHYGAYDSDSLRKAVAAARDHVAAAASA
ncbi:Na+/H+ antiporter NhaA [Frondihabitans peucedani]|uniref:Na(+)/H(+) antiporter NhaA n=1 Tax=Frondihabitans peucedani TaxID=598626 RepID=A0ABP8E6U2_9MICO